MQKARTKLVGYLKGNKARIDYGNLRRGGYPLGSGAIESANKFICHVRLKRSDAWWKIDNANNILKLRCAKYNENSTMFLRCMWPLTENGCSIEMLRSKG